MRKIVAAWIKDIATGVSGLVHIFNPEMVVIGGGVSAQGERLMAPLREQILAQVMPGFRKDLVIKPAALANDAGLLGAVRFCLDREGE